MEMMDRIKSGTQYRSLVLEIRDTDNDEMVVVRLRLVQLKEPLPGELVGSPGHLRGELDEKRAGRFGEYGHHRPSMNRGGAKSPSVRTETSTNLSCSAWRNTTPSLPSP